MNVIVPNKWSDVNVDKYQQFMIHQDNDKLTEKQRVKLMVGVLCDVDIKIVDKIKYTDLMKIHKELQKLVKTYSHHFDLQKRITLNNIKYGFNPNLSIITGGEFADIEHFLKDSIVENMHNIMAVLYRPIIDDDGVYYNIEPYEPNTTKYDDFKKLKMDVVLGAVVFFYNLGAKLQKNTNNYLKQQQVKKKKIIKEKVKH